MLKTESRQIGEHTYEVTQLAAVPARAAFLRLGKIVGPILRQLATAKTSGELTVDQAIAAGLGGLLENLTPEDLDYFCELFAKSTCVVMTDENTGATRKPKLSAILAVHFEGDALPNLFAWLAFCCEVNFAPFFAKIGDVRAIAGARQTA